MTEDDKRQLEEIGQLFAELRAEAGLSQRELAGLLGSTQATVSYFEAGKKTFKFSTLQHIARTLGYEVEVTLVPIVDPEQEAFNELLRETMAEIEAEGLYSREDANV